MFLGIASQSLSEIYFLVLRIIRKIKPVFSLKTPKGTKCSCHGIAFSSCIVV